MKSWLNKGIPQFTHNGFIKDKQQSVWSKCTSNLDIFRTIDASESELQNLKKDRVGLLLENRKVPENLFEIARLRQLGAKALLKSKERCLIVVDDETNQSMVPKTLSQIL